MPRTISSAVMTRLGLILYRVMSIPVQDYIRRFKLCVMSHRHLQVGLDYTVVFVKPSSFREKFKSGNNVCDPHTRFRKSVTKEKRGEGYQDERSMKLYNFVLLISLSGRN